MISFLLSLWALALIFAVFSEVHFGQPDECIRLFTRPSNHPCFWHFKRTGWVAIFTEFSSISYVFWNFSLKRANIKDFSIRFFSPTSFVAHFPQFWPLNKLLGQASKSPWILQVTVNVFFCPSYKLFEKSRLSGATFETRFRN